MSQSTTPELDTLECDHCGGVAVTANANNMFSDGMGSECGCESCGFPGSVSTDLETAPWWSSSDDSKARCRQLYCDECKIARQEDLVEATELERDTEKAAAADAWSRLRQATERNDRLAEELASARAELLRFELPPGQRFFVANWVAGLPVVEPYRQPTTARAVIADSEFAEIGEEEEDIGPADMCGLLPGEDWRNPSARVCYLAPGHAGPHRRPALTGETIGEVTSTDGNSREAEKLRRVAAALASWRDGGEADLAMLRISEILEEP